MPPLSSSQTTSHHYILELLYLVLAYEIMNASIAMIRFLCGSDDFLRRSENTVFHWSRGVDVDPIEDEKLSRPNQSGLKFSRICFLR